MKKYNGRITFFSHQLTDVPNVGSFLFLFKTIILTTGMEWMIKLSLKKLQN